MAVFVRILPAAALLVATAASLGAQQAAAPACAATQPTSSTALKANLTLNQALKSQQAKADPAGISKNLTSTVKTLEGEKGGDPATSYILGSALALWMNQPGISLTPKRSAVGFSSNPEATIDLPSAIDSLFTIVETKEPSCAYYTAYWRGGQQAYLDLVNGAINALNADKLDSAQFLATQANKLYSASPYGTMVLGNIASKKGNNDEAVKYWQQAATAAASDTSYRDVERQVLGNVASVYLNKARDNATPKAQQVEAAKKAAETYDKILAIPGGKGQAVYGARQNLQAALLIAGDTASATKSYAELLANPSAYEYQDLLNAAVTASRANKTADAAKLFDAALQANPYNRDALFNLAVTYLSLGENDKVPPVVTRLVAVDPGNPENYLLAARAYVDIAKTRKGAAATTAVNDTTMMWFNKGSQLPVEVTFSEVSTGEKAVEIAGRVLDRRDKAAAAAAGSTTTTRGAAGTKKAAATAKASLPPKAVTLKFDAIDKAGTVLGSQSVTVDPLEPGKSAPFRVSIPAANAIAYRYTIVN
jgi:tetratricopeptide (TPR) repeat protein